MQTYGANVSASSIDGVSVDRVTVMGVDARKCNSVGMRPTLFAFREMARQEGVQASDRDVCEAWKAIPLMACSSHFVHEAIAYLKRTPPKGEEGGQATGLVMDARDVPAHEGPVDVQRGQMD